MMIFPAEITPEFEKQFQEIVPAVQEVLDQFEKKTGIGIALAAGFMDRRRMTYTGVFSSGFTGQRFDSYDKEVLCARMHQTWTLQNLKKPND